MIATNKAVKIIGNFTGTPRDLQQILDMVRRGQIRAPEPRIFRLEEANYALDAAKAWERRGKGHVEDLTRKFSLEIHVFQLIAFGSHSLLEKNQF